MVQMVHFLTREKNTLDLILTTLPGQFQDIHSPDKLSDHDLVSGTLKIFIPPIKKPRRKVYLYQKGDYESMRKDTLEFAKEKYFSGHSDTRSVQNFDLLTSFIQDSADKHIPSKTNRSVDIKLFILVGLDRSFFVCCFAHRGSTVGFLLLQCSSAVVRHPGDLRVSVATRFCRVLIFASSQYLTVIYLFPVVIHC